MTSLFFVVPAHGRLDKSRVCLRQLSRTCDTLSESGVQAHVIVVAEDENLDIAAELGFLTVPCGNSPLGRKWNEGYLTAGKSGADFVVPFGSDDWVDPNLFLLDLLPEDKIRCSRQSAVVREDGRRITQLSINYHASHDYGDGVRVLPKALMDKVGWRPVEGGRERAIDTSIIRKLSHVSGKPEAVFCDIHPYQIVDFKSGRGQLNSYDACRNFRASQELDPWEELAGRYPDEALAEMREVYGL